MQNSVVFIINLHLHIHALQFLWDGTFQQKKIASLIEITTKALDGAGMCQPISCAAVSGTDEILSHSD